MQGAERDGGSSEAPCPWQGQLAGVVGTGTEGQAAAGALVTAFKGTIQDL